MSRPSAISAVIPCFNVGGYLLETIDSLLGQTTPPMEILVVDDASTDPETLDALRVAEGRPCTKVMRQGRNAGVARARNAGIDAATGDAVVFLDGDDLFHRDALGAFADALDGSPDAGFAYPTVTCFGNRTDTFVAPPFNLYVLHHINICPIAGMVRRAVLGDHLRFDPQIDVGHEDWDFWLRVAAAGHMGTAAPNAVMYYRRVGFTRMDLGNRVEGSFDRQMRRRRTEIFAPARLAEIKRAWSPAATIVAPEGKTADAFQTTRDWDVIAPETPGGGRGKITVVAPGGIDAVLGFPSAMEQLISLHESRPALQCIALVNRPAVHAHKGALDRLAENDMRRGWVELGDVCALSFSRQNGAPNLPAGSWDEVCQVALGVLAALARDNPRAVSWRVGPAATTAGRHLVEPLPTVVDAGPDPARSPEEEWLHGVHLALRAALPWRLLNGAEALFTDRPDSSLRPLRTATDPAEGVSLFTEDEHIPDGIVLGSVSVSAHVTEVVATRPVFRVLNPSTGRRDSSVGPPPQGYFVETLLGHVEARPVPGTVCLPDVLGEPGWGFPSSLAETAPDPVPPLIASRRWWRAVGDDGLHRYGASRRQLERRHRVEGVVCQMLAVAPHGAQARPLRALPDRDGRAAVGVELRPWGVGERDETTPAIGWLFEQPAPGASAIWVLRQARTGDILCSNVAGEGTSEGYGDAQLLGYGRA